ncbi:MAG TPA: nuclear transport factor 2 family protein [Candidatus Sulfotelmatobacter sp.]
MSAAGLWLILACALLPAAAQEALEIESESAIRALEHAWYEDQSRNNNQALDLIFDNELVYVEYGKLITKGEYLSRVKNAEPHPSQISVEAMTVRMFGDAGIVVGTYRDNSAESGKARVRRWRFVDTWVYKKGRWMLVAATAAPVGK